MDTLESHSPPSESVNFQKTLDESSPNSPPPPTQTLDDPLTSRDETLDDCSDSGSQEVEDEAEAGDLSPPSPISFLYPPWDCYRRGQPWSLDEDRRHFRSKWLLAADTKPSDFEAWHSSGETGSKPLLPTSPGPFLWDDEKPSMVGAGLANLGNTCFLNAVLQCFTHTVLLVQGLCSYTHAMPCEGNVDQFCVFCALRDQIELSLASTGRIVRPLKFVDNLSNFSSTFQRFQQEDAHEFLQCFLDRLDGCCNNLKTKDTALPSQDDNLVKQVFGGRLVSKLRCCNCNHSSDTYEPSIDLSLEIEDVDTLLTALESFTKVEKIEDAETKFMCENCKEEVSVEKQLMLERAPLVSALHLKRFKNYGSYVEKIDKHLEFPLELDLQPYTSGSQNNNVDLKYDLYAVVVHAAFTSTCGHYYCFIRSAPDTWYKFDDSKVIRVREAYVFSQEAYILFYAKQGTPWFSSFMETHKPSLDPNISNNSPKSVLDNVDPVCTSPPNVTNNDCRDINETSEAADEISTESFSRSIHDRVEVSGAKVHFHEMDTTIPLGPSNSFGGTSYKVKKVFSPSALKDHNFNLKLDEIQNNASVPPKTPPRSPSPDLYKEELPERFFSTKHDVVKSADKIYCKRQWSKYSDDPRLKEAHKQCKNMAGDRGAKLLAAALRGCENNGSLNKKSKKSRRMASSPNRKYSRSSDRPKPGHNSVSRSLAATSFR